MLSTKRRRLVRAEAETNPGYGKPPSKRTVEELIENGVIIADKPAGPSSHQVSAWVRDIFGVAKAGHGGTLDPNVTGVLPVALSNATKAICLLHSAGKEYVTVMRLHGDESEERIRQGCSHFIGKMKQTPPREAAVKRIEREREVYYLDIMEIKGRDVLFKVGCEGGTYIRVLCEDIGELLGCGAHMHELRRTRSGIFEESDARTLHDVLDSYIFWKEDGNNGDIKNIIRPMEDLLAHLPAVVVRDSAVDAICHGASLALPGVLQIDTGIKKDTVIVVKTLKGEGVAIGRAVMATRDMMERDTGISADISRVLMRKGTYPPMWKKQKK